MSRVKYSGRRGKGNSDVCSKTRILGARTTPSRISHTTATSLLPDYRHRELSESWKDPEQQAVCSRQSSKSR